MANLRANNLTGTGGRNAIDGSVSFDGGSSLTVADNSGYEFGTGDFTIECWINASDLTHERHLPIIQKGNSATNNLYDWRLYFNNHGSGSSLLYFDIACSGVSIGTNSTSVFVEKDWNHVAVTRQSGAFKVFFNGILEDTDSTTANAIDDDYTEIKIGFNDLGSAADSYLKGYISNLRIIKGTALYTASFTPPTEKLIGVDGTTLLCCQDSDDPTQEATGKSITGYGKLAAGQPIQPKVLPSVGVDEGVVFDGDTKVNSQGVMYFPTGDTSQRGRGRAVIGGGSNPSKQARMDYFQIQFDSSGLEFGDLTQARGEMPGLGSATRGLFAGGTTGSRVNTIDFVTFTTTGNATDFGDSLSVNSGSGGCGSGTRGLMMGGRDPANLNTIQYLTFATTGNTIDFGDLTVVMRNTTACSSPTRGVQAGGTSTPTDSNVMNYVTIASTGNATDFGDVVTARHGLSALSSNTRGVIAGGYDGSNYNIIEYVTIATTGNTTDFGDLTKICGWTAPFSNSIRGAWVEGNTPASPYITNTVDYVNIASLGNANRFGELPYTGAYGFGGCSDSSGGLTQ